jgi:hypothetical protein
MILTRVGEEAAVVFVLVFFWLIMAGLVAVIAGARGRSSGGWLLYGLVLMPIAFIHVNVLKNDRADSSAVAGAGRGLRFGLAGDTRGVGPGPGEPMRDSRRATLLLAIAVAGAVLLALWARIAAAPSAVIIALCGSYVVFCQGTYALWGGVRYGRFRLGYFRAPASRSAQPVLFWVLAFLHGVLTVAALVVLALASYAVMHGRLRA